MTKGRDYAMGDKNEPSLLQILRARDRSSNDGAYQDPLFAANQKMTMLIRHRDEFPVKLRNAIDTATKECPSEFLKNVYDSFETFFMGRKVEMVGHGSESHLIGGSWVGLDSEIDTEDEVEVAIRFLPSILTKKLWPTARMNQYLAPTRMLFTEPKAVEFVPIFLLLYDKFSNMYYDWMFECTEQLLMSGVRTFEIHFNVTSEIAQAAFGGPTVLEEELDRKSLLALERMMVLDCNIKESNTRLTNYLIALVNRFPDRNTGDFFEKRLRLLFELDPSSFRNWWPDGWYANDLERIKMAILRVFVELGMKYFPDALGFVFTFPLHNKLKMRSWETAEKVFLDQISVLSRRLGQSRRTTLKGLIINAATNSDILLDGVYTLLRSDPAVLMLPASPIPSEAA